MRPELRILLVDDHIGDITWLVDYLRAYGYYVDQITNEKAARRHLASIKEGAVSYVLAIIDIMISTMDIMELIELDEDFYQQSRDAGIRLCRYAREELKLSARELPIVCISARADAEEIQQPLKLLEIPLFSRVPQDSEESIRDYLKANLRRVE